MAIKKVRKIKKFPETGNFKEKSLKKQGLINKNMSFSEIVRVAPEAAEVLFENGMHCIGCGMAVAETLEQGAYAHGLDPNKLVEEINKRISKKDKKK